MKKNIPVHFSDEIDDITEPTPDTHPDFEVADKKMQIGVILTVLVGIGILIAVAIGIGFAIGNGKAKQDIRDDQSIQNALRIEKARQIIKEANRSKDEDTQKIKDLYRDIAKQDNTIRDQTKELNKYGLTLSNYDTGTGTKDSQ